MYSPFFIYNSSMENITYYINFVNALPLSYRGIYYLIALMFTPLRINASYKQASKDFLVGTFGFLTLILLIIS
jgi:hypothetical protein